MIKILISLLLLTFTVSGQTEESKAINPKWKLFEGANYTLQYPPEWELNTNGTMGTTLILFSPVESSHDQFKENVNLLIQDLTGHNIDLDKYSEISEEQISKMITNSKVIESKRMKNGSEEYHHIIYTGDQGIFHLKFEQFYWVKNKKAFVLTLTCEQTTFDDYKEIGETILNSFTFNY